MKLILVLLLVIGMCMIIRKPEQPAETQSEDELTAAWLRDGESAERHAAVKVGSFFVTERNTVYGADCTGCTLNDGIASTSSQIEVTTESVRQSDGSWKTGITYDGYYLIAADEAFPMCTVVRISEHTYSGEGLEANKPFNAIVVDRGSMIVGAAIDLFAGSEENPKVIHDELSGAVVEVIGFLSYQRNEQGQMSCAGE